MIFNVNFYTEKGSCYTESREYESEFECIDSLHGLEWFILKNKKGHTTMINKDWIKSIVISEVKTNE